MPLTARQRSIHNKNGAKRTTSFNKGKRKSNGGDYLVTSAPTDLRSISYPGGAVALFMLLTARIISACWNHVSDCDETYNYWEPLHYLVYGKGLQTWEYSPEFAIRSYMPLWQFAVPAKLLSYIMEPVTVFYTLRVLLAVLYSCVELMFYKAVCHEFGVNIGRLWLLMAVPSAGMFASSTAMLPASWSGALMTAALAAWWKRKMAIAVMLTAVSALLSWPFTALIGIPIAIDMLIYKKQIFDFIRWSTLSLLAILVPTVAVDSWHYGRLVVAPWNIVAYNIFTEHGPDLYGVEPWTYYFVNGFLNFNIVWANALVAPVMLFVCAKIINGSTSRATFCNPYWLDLMPLYLWLAVFMLQPHKEERFLYPVYSLIILGGAISVDCLLKGSYAISCHLMFGRRDKNHYLSSTGPLMVMFVAVAAVLGISRITATYTNYHGPLALLRHLPPAPDHSELTLCYGKDWYRSPSNFHLPRGYSTRFIKSEFDGQMPAPYSEAHNATRLLHPYFNDINRGDNRTYVKPTDCHYIVDSDLGVPSALQPAYHKDTKTWEVIATAPILDAEKSHRFLRAFYVPFVSSKYNVFANMYLLKNKLADG